MNAVVRASAGKRCSSSGNARCQGGERDGYNLTPEKANESRVVMQNEDSGRLLAVIG